MKTLFFISLVIISNCICAQYAPPAFTDPDRMKKIEAALPVIREIYLAHAQRNNFPGLAYGVVVDGKMVSMGTVGYSDVKNQTKTDGNTMFRIASMSKSVTAVAILQLRDKGLLDLDDPVSKYIPQMKQNKLLTKDAPAITIRHLLTHAAGFPEDNPWGDRQMADTDKELVDLIANGTSFSNVPGVTYEYSNLGFALLGYVVARVSKMPFDQYTAKHIFEPLGMKNTQWEYTKIPKQQLAHGYRWQNNTWVEEQLLGHGSWGSMGGLITSIEDFGKYMALHINAWPPRDEAESSVLKRSSLREMHMPSNFSGFNPGFRYPNGRQCGIVSAYAYGLGWVLDCTGRTYISHSGGLPGFGSQWRMMPDYGIGVVAFANLTYAGFGNVNFQVLDTLIKLADLKPRAIPASVILKQRQNELMTFLPHWNNATSSEIFAENFFPDYVLDSLKKEYTTAFQKIGKVMRVGEMRPENQLRGRFTIFGEKGDIELFFTLNEENPPRIQQLNLREIPRKP